MEDSVGTQKTKIPTGMQEVKVRIMRFQMGRGVLGIGLEAIHVIFWKRVCPHFVLVMSL
jgi:hypothetical protein